jgi:predicted alpha/beta hydrolase family esterase
MSSLLEPSQLEAYLEDYAAFTPRVEDDNGDGSSHMEATGKQAKDCTVLYLHGLDTGPTGSKVVYLKRKFDTVIAPNLMTKTWDMETNSIFTQAVRNLPYLLVGEWYTRICGSMLDGAAAIAEDVIVRCKPDIVVASSMGGATALELIARGVIKVPTLLLAPALKKMKLGGGDTALVSKGMIASIMDPWYETIRKQILTTSADSVGDDGSLAGRSTDFPIIVVHGDNDATINLEDSVELCARINAELVTVSGGDHRMNDYLLDGAEHRQDQLEALIQKLWDSRRQT